MISGDSDAAPSRLSTRLAASSGMLASAIRLALMTPPITPTARVPPMVRKNIVLAVAMPRCSHATLVCTAMRSAVFAKPMPTPNMPVITRRPMRPCVAPKRASETPAAAVTPSPKRMSGRKPTRGIRRPAMALATGQVITMGVIAVPAWVGVP